MAHSDFCNTSTTSGSFSDSCINFNNYADAYVDGCSYSDSSPLLCSGAFQGDFHVDNLTCHNNVAHSDTAHTDTHSNVAAWDDHSDSHWNVAHTDTHSDVSHSDTHAHNCTHSYYVNYTAEEGEHFTGCAWAFYNSCGYGHCNFEDCSGVGTKHYDWYVYKLHNNSHNDISHSDTHSNVAHSDTHSDEWYNAPHSDTHSNVAFVNILFSDHCDHTDSN